jgi:MarR family transcriptional regulator, transcriptional regulator for hemolysin
MGYNNAAYDHQCHARVPGRVGWSRGACRGGERLTDFQHDLLFLLHDLGRLLRVDADKRARAEGMTRAQWGILLWLERQPGMSQKELSELLEVEPISVARLVDRLEARAMVERRPDPKDRRIWRLHLCPTAHPALREIHRHRAAMARRLTAGIDPATLDTMADVLVLMKATLSHEPRAQEPRAHESRPHAPRPHEPRLRAAAASTPPHIDALEIA